MKKHIKIAFTGPESSGKTTLAMWLSQKLDAVYCEEYAREYLDGRLSYTQADLTEIAKGQIKIWEKASKEKILVADTEMIVIEIWSRWKYKNCDPIILELLSKQKFDLFFLCKPDIPWEYDSLRESEHEREALFQFYLKKLLAFNCIFFVLEGDLKSRKSAIQKELENMGISF